MLKLSDFSAVIFDMDGLVLDTETTYFVAWQLAANAMGYELSETFCLSLSGLHFNDIEPKLMARCGADFNLQAFKHLSGIFWREHVNANGIAIKHGFTQLLEYIVQNRIPYCLATNSRAVNAYECLELAGIKDGAADARRGHLVRIHRRPDGRVARSARTTRRSPRPHAHPGLPLCRRSHGFHPGARSGVRRRAESRWPAAHAADQRVRDQPREADPDPALRRQSADGPHADPRHRREGRAAERDAAATAHGCRRHAAARRSGLSGAVRDRSVSDP